MDPLNNPTFVRKLIAGDATSFSTLCNSLKNKLPEFIVREIGLNYSDAEEIASYALFKAHAAIKSFQPKGGAKLTTWIFEIAKHAAIDHRRKLASASRDSINEQYADLKNNFGEQNNPSLKHQSQYEAETLDEDAVTDSLRILPYRNAFEKLSDREKDILRMKNVMTYDEISEIEGETVGSLRTRHSRALKRLRGLIEE